jgi:predicted TIM-barrel fold metal-dependent hydrolase
MTDTVSAQSIPEAPTARALVDADTHPFTAHKFGEYLPKRWASYIDTYGRRNLHNRGVTPPQRPYAARLDAAPPNGGPPGSDPEFAREQLLDLYGMTYAMLNSLDSIALGNAPVELEIELARAANTIVTELWLESDPRWIAAISIPQEHPREAVAEIERCLAMSPRWVQVLFGSRLERPLGNPKYWPIFEVAEAAGIPVATHVGTSKYHYMTGVGPPSFYFESHGGYPTPGQANVPSLIFEGVFDRFPGLKVVLAEQGWEWVVPYAWRLDSTWRVQRSEVPDLQREPSAYFRDHFYFTTQPAVETEVTRDIYRVYRQLDEAGFGGHLMFSSDYPHWDMDSPFEAIPNSLEEGLKRRVLAGNAAALYGLELPA